MRMLLAFVYMVSKIEASMKLATKFRNCFGKKD